MGFRYKFILTLIVTSLFGLSKLIAQNKDASPPTLRSDLKGFSVDVTLSENAMKKLIENKETIVVIGFFTGSPKPGLPAKQYKQFLSRPGPIGLGEVEVEVSPGERARFDDIKLKQEAVAFLDSDGPQLLINVVSGRKSSTDNLLECDIYEGALKSVQGTRIPIKCKLIQEAFSTSPIAAAALSKVGSSSSK
jgi:hypothetical protein